MQLQQVKKQQLLRAAQKVYFGFLALDFYKSFKINENSLEEIVSERIRNRQYGEQTIEVSGKNYVLNIEAVDENNFNVSLNDPLQKNISRVIKKPSTYNESEVAVIISGEALQLSRDRNGRLKLSNQLSEDLAIGGNKYDLYRTHLATLYNIITKINSEEDITNLLVALATGSGKTFVQALWMLVLEYAGFNSIFAIPEKLVPQFKDDLRNLLPDNLVDEVDVITSKTSSGKVAEIATRLKDSSATREIMHTVIATEILFDGFYQHLEEMSDQNTFLSVDEQHLAMNKEKTRVRLIEASKKFLSMFLTATPNAETYKLCGSKPVAIMSSGQKETAGQGKFPEVISLRAKNMTDKDRSVKRQSFGQRVLRKMLLTFANNIAEEGASAAASVVESLPTMLLIQEEETNSRFKYQLPMARKMLTIVEDNSELVNLYKNIDTTSYLKPIYRDGNLIAREEIFRFFPIADVDDDISCDYRIDEQRKFAASLPSDTPPATRQLLIEAAGRPLQEQLKLNVLSGLVEWYLCDLTGMNSIELNRMRKNSLTELVELIRSKHQSKASSYYVEKLQFNAKTNPNGIDATGSQQAAEILTAIDMLVVRNLSNEIRLSKIANNWSIDSTIHQELMRHYSYRDQSGNVVRPYINYETRQTINHFLEQYMVMGMMADMQQAETPIEHAKPFTKLEEDRYDIYEDGGVSKKAKIRKHDSIEILNSRSEESRFSPAYLELSDTEKTHGPLIADNYFKNGFVGMYVSNMKTEGFSDTNLHTVLNVANASSDMNNNPTKMIQGIGRNRGLDQTQQPAYIYALGKGAKPIFKLDNLKKDDYYTDLHRSQKKFKKVFLQSLGNQTAIEIRNWVNQNMRPDETIDSAALKKHVYRIIARKLRVLNNENSHNIRLSRKELRQVVNYARTQLQKEIDSTKNPYKLSFFCKVLAAILNFMTGIYYGFISLKANCKMFFKRVFSRNLNQADKVYMKILKHLDYKKIISKFSVLNEYKQWLSSRKNVVETKIERNLLYYLNSEMRENVSQNIQETLIPILLKFICRKKRTEVSEILSRTQNWSRFYYENKELIQKIYENPEKDFSNDLVKILKSIHGLEGLSKDDLSNPQAEILQLRELISKESNFQILDVKPIHTDIVEVASEFFVSEQFRNNISGVLTCDDVAVICRALSTKEGLPNDNARHLAGWLLRNRIALSEMDPATLLTSVVGVINRSCKLNIKTAQQKGAELEEGIQGVITNFSQLGHFWQLTTGYFGPTSLLSGFTTAQVIELEGLMRNNLYPLLAMSLRSVEARQQFVDGCISNKNAIQFIMANRDQMTAVLDGSMRDSAAIAIFMSTLSNDTINGQDIVIDKITHAQQGIEAMQSTVKENIATKLLGNRWVQSKLSYAYDDESFAAVRELLDSSENRRHLAQAVLRMDNINDLFPSRLDELFNQVAGDESAIQSLVSRVDALKSIKDDILKWFDERRVTELVSNELSKVLFDKNFVSLMNEMIGYLSEEDMAYMLGSGGLNKENPAARAKQLKDFLKCISKQNLAELQSNYCSVSKDSEDRLELDKLPLKDIVADIVSLVQEVSACHQTYHVTSDKGMKGRNTTPSFFTNLSGNVAAIRVDGNDSGFDHFARKIRFLRGVQLGLPEASKVSGKAHAYQQAPLQRVNDHILRPMAWGLGISAFFYSIVKFGRDCYTALSKFVLYIGYMLKHSFNKLFRYRKDPASKQALYAHQLDDDFELGAFDLISRVNKLKSFTRSEVSNHACKDDSICTVEDYVNDKSEAGTLPSATI